MPIQCQSDVNPSPIRGRSSANPSQSGAYPHNSGVVNSLAIQCQSSTNPFPIDWQSTAPFIPNRMSIHDQSIAIPSLSHANLVTIRWRKKCQFIYIPVPICCQSMDCQYNVNPRPMNVMSIHLPIHCQSNLSIHCKSINQMPILYQFHHQSSSNLQTPCQSLPSHANLPIQHQSINQFPILNQLRNVILFQFQYLSIHYRSINPSPILDQFLNMIPIHCHYANQMSIQFKYANPFTKPRQIHQYGGNSWPIHKRSPNSLPILDQSVNVSPIRQSVTNSMSISDPSASPPIPDRSENFDVSPLSIPCQSPNPMQSDKPILDQINAKRAASEPPNDPSTHISTRMLKTELTRIDMHRHSSSQLTANRRTFVHVIFELVYYTVRPKCLDGGRFRWSNML